MLFDIVCPLCMKRYPANSVVFRHNAVNLDATGNDLARYRGEDRYLQAYYTTHGIAKGSAIRMKVVDPAYFPEQDKVYSDGLLVGLRNRNGYQMEDRVCPYCHNKLYTSAGRMPMQQMAIVGASHSGKTTFEAAMIYQLRRDGIGCINNTLNEQGQIDDVVERNIEILMRGDPDRIANGTMDGRPVERVRASSGWSATENYHGPYIFSLTPGAEAQPLALAFYDLPGEHFRTNIQMISQKAPYIATARTCLCLVDLADIGTVSDVITALSSNFGTKMKQNDVNLALVLYKADQLEQAVEGIAKAMTPLTFQPHQPIDMHRIDASSEQLLKFVASRDYRLEGTYNAISDMLGRENVRLFMAQSFDEFGNFAPRGCDLPLLWSFARQGLYPQTT